MGGGRGKRSEETRKEGESRCKELIYALKEGNMICIFSLYKPKAHLGYLKSFSFSSSLPFFPFFFLLFSFFVT